MGNAKTMKNSICKTCNIQFNYKNKGRVRLFCSIDCYRAEQRKGIYTKDKKIIPTELFLSEAKTIHGNKYTYLINGPLFSNGSVTVVCEIHGEFIQKIRTHLKLGCGCKKCSCKFTEPKRKASYKKFLESAKSIHNETYIYPSHKEFINTRTNLRITCRKHGDFYQLPSNHIKSRGCIECGYEASGEHKKKSFSYFESKAREVHGNKYLYHDNGYISMTQKIKIECKTHGLFYQTGTIHLRGSGCQECSREVGLSWSKSSYVKLCNNKYSGQASMYLIKCYGNNEEFYKVGITTKGIKDRFRNKRDLPYDYNILHLISGSAEAIWTLEKRIHSSLREYKYKPCIGFGGETECFSKISKPVEKLLLGMSRSNQLQLIC